MVRIGRVLFIRTVAVIMCATAGAIIVTLTAMVLSVAATIAAEANQKIWVVYLTNPQSFQASLQKSQVQGYRAPAAENARTILLIDTSQNMLHYDQGERRSAQAHPAKCYRADLLQELKIKNIRTAVYLHGENLIGPFTMGNASLFKEVCMSVGNTKPVYALSKVIERSPFAKQFIFLTTVAEQKSDFQKYLKKLSKEKFSIEEVFIAPNELAEKLSTILAEGRISG